MKAARVLFRTDRTGEWRSNNPVLMLGEPGYDIQTATFRIGDGRNYWNNLHNIAGELGPTGSTGAIGSTGMMGPTGPGITPGTVFRSGTNYGNYYFWNDLTSTWVIGSTQVNLGTGSGEYDMEGAVAIGHEAGNTNQGEFSVAIGSFAGKNDQSANSIILNASGEEVTAQTSGLFVNPIRQATNPAGGVNGSLWYNPETNEICYN
jgi:hypothetical protein